jgi:hypothetical protein
VPRYCGADEAREPGSYLGGTDQPRHCIEKQMQLGEVFTVTWLEYEFKVEHNPHKCYFTNKIIKRGGKRCMSYLKAVKLKYHVDTFLRGAVKAAKIKKRIPHYFNRKTGDFC